MFVKKKGVSPVIASVLLMGIVITLAGIVFIWARGFVTEETDKFGEPIERACERIKFEAAIFRSGETYTLEVNNQANVPLQGFDVKLVGQGDVNVHEVLGSPIDLGESAQIALTDFQGIGSSVEEVLVVPILLGTQGERQTEFTCPDNYGVTAEVITS